VVLLWKSVLRQLGASESQMCQMWALFTPASKLRAILPCVSLGHCSPL
jgi:hypothetical protein